MGQMDKQYTVYSYNGMSISLKKEGKFDTWIHHEHITLSEISQSQKKMVYCHYVQGTKLRGCHHQATLFFYNSPFNLALKDANLSSALK